MRISADMIEFLMVALNVWREGRCEVRRDLVAVGMPDTLNAHEDCVKPALVGSGSGL